MDELILHVEGIGWWSPAIVDWQQLATRLRADERLVAGAPPARPPASVLPPNERRRAPEPVLLACEAAAQACAMAGRDASTLPCVFASVHGDLAITHEMCATLAADPLQLSPTRFHNSVHNAPAGYWTVATGCHAPSSAVSAWRRTFVAGLFEAAVQACADATPMLYAAYDASSEGPLAEVASASAPFALAFVLAPEHGVRTLATLRLRHEAQAVPDIVEPAAATLPLLAALARGGASTLRLASGATSTLVVEVTA